MLIQLTTQCSMGCSHCLDDAKPHGIHMSLENAHKIIETLKNKGFYDVPMLFSGGEPFENPQFKEVFELFHEFLAGKPITIATNGVALLDNPDTLEWLLDFRERRGGKHYVLVQVTNDRRYYPRVFVSSEILKLQRLGFIVDKVPQGLYYQGRAVENFPDFPYKKYTKAPKCANPKLLHYQLPQASLRDICLTLMMHGKVCIPKVNPEGRLALGESDLCPPIGYIWDDDSVLFDRMEKLTCKKCKPSYENFLQSHPELCNIVFKNE